MIATRERRWICSVPDKTFIKGRIYFNNRLSSMDCYRPRRHRQWQPLGVFGIVLVLPELFEIYLPNKDEYFQTRIEWRKGDNIGVSWTPEDTSNLSLKIWNRAFDHLFPIAARLEREIALFEEWLECGRSCGWREAANRWASLAPQGPATGTRFLKPFFLP